ncbi:MAG: SCPU domain-containing protein, partial [Comamonadaceae bacterium]
AFLAYDIYRDAGHSTPYPVSSAVTGIAIPITGAAFVLPIFGLVNKTTPEALPAGTYTDQLQITLTF